MSQPIRDAFGVKDKGGFATVTSDLVANLIASAVSMPLHQLYGYTVVSTAKRNTGYTDAHDVRKNQRRQIVLTSSISRTRYESFE